jgi:hypothetical protein
MESTQEVGMVENVPMNHTTAEDDPFGSVATTFGLLKGRFEEAVNDLSMGEMRRLIKALIEYPLTDKLHIDNMAREKLKDAFNIGDAMLQSKMIMMMLSLQEQEEQKQKLIQESKTNGEE